MNSITDLPGTRVHNPSAENHFMWINDVERKIIISRGDEILAETENAIRIIEVARSLYEPVYYLPTEDVSANLKLNNTITNCPIKGQAQGFDLVDDNGEVLVEYIAWHYTTPVDGAETLIGRTAFTAKHVSITDAPSN